MKKALFILIIVAACLPLAVLGQSVDAKAYYTDEEHEYQEVTSIDKGQAPLAVEFRANPGGMDGWTPSYEWHFLKMEGDQGFTELLVRYEETTEYTFTESGTYNVVLRTQVTNGTETNELDPQTIVVVVLESKLSFPNAFSPNDDGVNDTFKAKEYQSIVDFHAYIFNRWGQKLYEWTDPAGEWNGTYNGRPVKDGVYFLLVKARGADGYEYNIRRDVNILRGLPTSKTGEGSTSSTTD